VDRRQPASAWWDCGSSPQWRKPELALNTIRSRLARSDDESRYILPCHRTIGQTDGGWDAVLWRLASDNMRLPQVIPTLNNFSPHGLALQIREDPEFTRLSNNLFQPLLFDLGGLKRTPNRSCGYWNRRSDKRIKIL